MLSTVLHARVFILLFDCLHFCNQVDISCPFSWRKRALRKSKLNVCSSQPPTFVLQNNFLSLNSIETVLQGPFPARATQNSMGVKLSPLLLQFPPQDCMSSRWLSSKVKSSVRQRCDSARVLLASSLRIILIPFKEQTVDFHVGVNTHISYA